MIVINARFLTQEMRGAQRFAEQVCLALRELRDDVVFVCPPGIRMHASAQALGARVIGSHGGHRWEQWDLPRYLARQGNPLLVSLGASAPLFYRNQLAAHHAITYVRHPSSFSWVSRLHQRLMTSILLRATRGLLTVSQFSRREISTFYHYPAERILVVHNAASGAFQPGEPLSAEPRYLLAVASPDSHKNLSRMIQAFRALKNREQVELRIVDGVADHSIPSSLLQQAEGDARIRFLGRLSDEALIAQYQDATAFVFPSLYEGFGIAPLEAQACGCPVLAANASSIPEVLQSSALYFDPLDVEHMTRAMALVLSNLTVRQHLRTLGLHNVARFSWEASAQLVSERIDALLPSAAVVDAAPALRTDSSGL